MSGCLSLVERVRFGFLVGQVRVGYYALEMEVWMQVWSFGRRLKRETGEKGFRRRR